MVRDEGKYLYGIIGTDEARNFGPLGVGGRGDEVVTITYRNLSAIISNSPMTKYVVSRENLTAHEQVVERVMQEFTVLPARFCTIAINAEDIRRLLELRYREFSHLLRDMDNKIELGVKAFWRDLELIFREIVDENGAIARMKAEAARHSSDRGAAERIAIGKMVQAALEVKKEREGEEILTRLAGAAADYRVNKTAGDRMILNAAFLVDRGRERDFDDLMERLDQSYHGRIKFAYVGPVAPYNFVNITLRPEE
ncbi:MAG: GvpL/GvpF family gas vesicle protein [candidate division NC10 bacterium]